MSHTRRSRYSSRSASPYQQSRPFSRSLSRTPSRSRSWSRGCDSPDAVNHGNNLYVTGLSSNVSKAELQNHFAREGKVVDVHLVVDPYSRESRGFGFVTMGRIEEAERCIKYLDGSILDGRVITVEKAKRGRGRTPTPGRYLGLRRIPPHRQSPSRSPYRSRRRLSNSDRERSYSPYYYSRSPSPYRRRRYNRSPNRKHSSLESRSPSRSTGPYYSSRSPSPWLRRSSRRSYSRSISPAVRRRYRRSYSRSISPRRSYRRRRYSSSLSPRRHHRRSPSHATVSNKKRYSRESYSHSRSFSSHSTTVSSSSNTST